MSPKNVRHGRHDPGPNMTPLVDVVMVILIFLMLAGSFGTAEHFITSTTPIHGKNSSSAAPRPGCRLPVQVDVMVSAEGDASIFGALSAEPDPEKVREVLADRVSRLRALGPAGVTTPGGAETDVEVVLHPLPGTKWGRLAPLYDAAVRANASRVSLTQVQ